VIVDRLGAEDVRILKLERGQVRGHTCKVLVLEPADGRPLPSLVALREHVAARLDAAPRLRRRLVATPLGVAAPVWADDPVFAIERHVRGVETSGPVARTRLPGIVAELMAQRLDRAHPLWRIDVVPLEGPALALVWRIHHCLADGATAERIGSAVLWSEHPDEEIPPPSRWSPAPCPGPGTLLALGLADRFRELKGRRAREATDAASRREEHEAIRRELAPRAHPSPLDRPAGPARRVAFVQAPLGACHDAGKGVDASVTVNDVVLAIVAGGVRRWLQGRHRRLEGIRAKVPVSLHGHGAAGDAANSDSYFVVDLPVAERRPEQRLLAISREAQQRKRGHDAQALHRLALRRPVARWAMSPRVFTLGVSNVRGPAAQVYVMGARLSELHSVAEIAEHHALRICVISSAGTLSFGLCADRDAVPDLHVLVDGLRHATDELLALRRGVVTGAR
jgi:WS/DGAT/MGAT family acyltransferase